jgi:hypothetical protein
MPTLDYSRNSKQVILMRLLVIRTVHKSGECKIREHLDKHKQRDKNINLGHCVFEYTEVVGIFVAREIDEKCMKYLIGKPNGRDHFGGPYLDENIILRRIFMNIDNEYIIFKHIFRAGV